MASIALPALPVSDFFLADADGSGGDKNDKYQAWVWDKRDCCPKMKIRMNMMIILKIILIILTIQMRIMMIICQRVGGGGGGCGGGVCQRVGGDGGCGGEGGDDVCQRGGR